MIRVNAIRLDYGKLKGGNRYRITENSNPVFGWTVLSDGKNVAQKAYCIKVHSEREVLWETGWVESKVQEASYAGKELPFERRIYVSVRVRDSRGESSESYEEFFFRSALQKYQLKWVAPSEDKGDKALYFTKDFEKKKKAVHAVIYACGIGYHELYLNGERIDEAVLDPAVSDYTKHCYFTVLPEVEGMLEEQNCISAIVGQGWRRNEEGAPRGWEPVGFFGIPQLCLAVSITYEDSSSEVISTDESWLCGEGPITYSHLFNGEVFDARLLERKWNCFGGKPDSFTGVKVVDAPGGKTESMILEPVRKQEVYPARTVTPLSEQTCVVDFGQNIAGVCALRIPEGLERGQCIRIKFAEYLDEDGSVYMETLRTAESTDTYIAAGDGNDLEVWKPDFTYHGFRYAQIEGIAMINPQDIAAVSCYTDVKTSSFFTSGSALVNAIQNNIVQTEKANIHSILTDCPQRDERLGWMNDATVRFEQVPYNFDVGRLFPKVVEDILDTQSADGAITCTAPFVLGFRPADPVCSSFLIAGQQAVLHTGNVDIIGKGYAGFARWEERIGKLAKDYIIEYSHYGDWAAPVYACKGGDKNIDATRSECTPGSFMSTGYYYFNAALLKKFASILKKKEDESYYKRLAEKIKQAVLEKWWDDEHGIMATGSQGCQSFALWLDIIPPNRCHMAAKVIHDDLVKKEYRFTTGNLCTRYMLEMLTKYGYVDDAWELITREEYPSIGYMIQNEATTIWERFELKKSKEMNSHNHPMYGAVGHWFYAYLAGVKPVEKGFDKMVIQPYFPRKLLSVNAKIETPKGDVAVRWVRRYGKVFLYVTLPFGTCAEIYFAGEKYSAGSGFHVYEVKEEIIFKEDEQNEDGERQTAFSRR